MPVDTMIPLHCRCPPSCCPVLLRGRHRRPRQRRRAGQPLLCRRLWRPAQAGDARGGALGAVAGALHRSGAPVCAAARWACTRHAWHGHTALGVLSRHGWMCTLQSPPTLGPACCRPAAARCAAAQPGRCEAHLPAQLPGQAAPLQRGAGAGGELAAARPAPAGLGRGGRVEHATQRACSWLAALARGCGTGIAGAWPACCCVACLDSLPVLLWCRSRGSKVCTPRCCPPSRSRP